MLLRIEDIDATRCRPEFVAGIFEDLRWLGVAFEEPVRRQSAHVADYQAASAKLQAAGLLYPCFASRKEIEAAVGTSAERDPDGAPMYPGLWRDADPVKVARRKQAGEPYALRLDMHRALSGQARPSTWRGFEPSEPSMARNHLASPGRWGDAVIVRKEIPTSYHLSVVADDAFQGVTHVVRGQDLEAATDLHRLLQALLGLPSPLYHHHRLIVGPIGRKLSKSFSDTSLGQLRREGATPGDVRHLVGLV